MGASRFSGTWAEMDWVNTKEKQGKEKNNWIGLPHGVGPKIRLGCQKNRKWFGNIYFSNRFGNIWI
jgi:hypothetical protein